MINGLGDPVKRGLAASRCSFSKRGVYDRSANRLTRFAIALIGDRMNFKVNRSSRFGRSTRLNANSVAFLLSIAAELDRHLRVYTRITANRFGRGGGGDSVQEGVTDEWKVV